MTQLIPSQQNINRIILPEEELNVVKTHFIRKLFQKD